MTDANPGGGERVAGRDNVMNRFSGGPPIETAADPRGSVRRLIGRFGAERAGLVLVLVLTAAGVALIVYGPRLLGDATDVIITGLRQGEIDMDDLGVVLLKAAGVYLGGFVLSWAQAHLLANVVQRTLRDLRQDIEEKVHRLPLSYVDRIPRGDLLSRATNDIDNLSTALQFTLSQFLNSILTVAGITVMMMLISPVVALFSLALIPASMFTVRYVSRLSKRRFMDQWRHTGDLNAQIEETFTGHNLVKVFGLQASSEKTFEHTNDELHDAAYRAQVMIGIMQPVMMLLGNLNYVAIAVVGGLRVSSGSMSIGEIQAFVQYSRRFNQPLTQIAGSMNQLQSGIASAERVFVLLDAPEQSPDPADPAELPVTHGRVEFSHVSFSYDPDKPLIQDLSLVAEPGQMIAIVGPTGAGKTTLVNLIMRFYEIDGGTITIDGVDTATMTRHHLRSQLGMVLQDTWLLEGTIRDNLRYGRIDASEEDILEAARVAYVDRFVHSLPDGYDTIVDEAGTNLSAGEIQLLTIARAFLSDPAILILDEATSSVDTRTEVLVQHAMASLRSRRTSFVIAHRLSTIRDADIILMMRDGQIVEQGSHEELLANRGPYFELYDSQFRAAAVDDPDEVGAGAPSPNGSATPRPAHT